MARPLLAVILGTFTLRLSTGLTGGALVYYLNDLEKYGGPHADAITIAVFSALFYASELVGSPLFGVLSDRLGHRRVLLFGPVFGGDRGGHHGLHHEPARAGRDADPRGRRDGGVRALDPRVHRLRHRGRRGRAGPVDGAVRGGHAGRPPGRVRPRGPAVPAARAGRVPAQRPRCTRARSRSTSFGVPKDAEPPPHPDQGMRGTAALGRYRKILVGSHVWLLAPTWIAINATLGPVHERDAVPARPRARTRSSPTSC